MCARFGDRDGNHENAFDAFSEEVLLQIFAGFGAILGLIGVVLDGGRRSGHGDFGNHRHSTFGGLGAGDGPFRSLVSSRCMDEPAEEG